MDGEGASYEEDDEFRRVVSKTFRTEDEGYQFYNEYAKVKGFSVRKEEVKYLPGTRTIFRRLYTCFKEGYRTLANFERPDPKRTEKALTRCGCTAHLEIELSAATGEWFVKKFQPYHNHQLAKEGESAYLYSHRKMTDGQKADVVGYGIGGLRTHEIMDVMEQQAGGPDKLGYGIGGLRTQVKGFSFRKEEVKYLPGTRTRFRRLYTCFKEGYRTLANFERPDPKTNQKALARCGCTAHLKIELSAAIGEWSPYGVSAAAN